MSVVTDHIETFTEKGLKLRSGAELEADLIVTATGLNLSSWAGPSSLSTASRVDLSEDHELQGHDVQRRAEPGVVFRVHERVVDAQVRPDLRVCLSAAQSHGKDGATAVHATKNDPSITEEPFVDFSSGYLLRSLAKFPKQGSKKPWRLHQNYALDLLALRYSAVQDDAIQFTR